MPTRHADAVWEGKVQSGHGEVHFGDYRGGYSYASRMENGAGTNPEQLLGAAHAACFSMALALELGQAQAQPRRVATTAAVRFDRQDGGFAITGIELQCEAEVDNITPEAFAEIAEKAKRGCPVSKALQAVPIQLQARLIPAQPERKTA